MSTNWRALPPSEENGLYFEAAVHPEWCRKLILDRASGGDFGMRTPSENAAVALIVREVRAAMANGLTNSVAVREELNRRVRALEAELNVDSDVHDAWLVLSMVFADIIPEECEPGVAFMWLASAGTLRLVRADR